MEPNGLIRVRRSWPANRGVIDAARVVLCGALLVLCGPAFAQCEGRLALQVLGSGGPIADDARASSGYLLWIDGHARLLVDAGGGTFLRFGESGANIEDLEAILLTHLHTDHATDLPALLKGGYFSDRTRPLPVIGPDGAPGWPGVGAFMHGLFAPGSGVFRYLAGFLDGSDQLFETPVVEVDHRSRIAQTVIDEPNLEVRVIGVRHGVVPALGVLIEAGAWSIALTGDQNDDNPQFVELAKGANLLVVDHAIPASAGEVARALHLTPQAIGRMAAEARVGHLVLSHLMARSLRHLEQSRDIIGQRFAGPVSVAEDLACFVIDRGPVAR
ncbi:MAG: MBL fold metallo-hydrolase [Gammaproteobacteria bacterium]|nr:MBL fold metallo-hydrolase [Gammaproteobacteria bacterium]